MASLFTGKHIKIVVPATKDITNPCWTPPPQSTIIRNHRKTGHWYSVDFADNALFPLILPPSNIFRTEYGCSQNDTEHEKVISSFKSVRFHSPLSSLCCPPLDLVKEALEQDWHDRQNAACTRGLKSHSHTQLRTISYLLVKLIGPQGPKNF